MPVPSWLNPNTLAILGQGSFPGQGPAPTLANLGASPFADRFGQWSSTTTPSGRLPAWEPDRGPAVPFLPSGNEPGVGGYLPPQAQASGTSVPDERPDAPNTWAVFFKNLDLSRAPPAPAAPPFAFAGRAFTPAALGGQRGVAQMSFRPPTTPSAGPYG